MSTSPSHNRIELTGRVFGSWTVEAFGHTSDDGQTHWKCRCKCGTEAVILGLNLREGRSKMCKKCRDIANGAKSTTHGASKTKDPFRRYLYCAWWGIRARCYNKNATVYRWYGAAGIGIHEPWIFNFSMFETWIVINLGIRPSERHTLDRINGKMDYEPGNLRWATAREQANNLSSNRLLYFGGETLTLSLMSEKHGKDPRLVQSRLNHGWTIPEALTLPVGYRHKTGWKGDILFSAHTL